MRTGLRGNFHRTRRFLSFNKNDGMRAEVDQIELLLSGARFNYNRRIGKVFPLYVGQGAKPCIDQTGRQSFGR